MRRRSSSSKSMGVAMAASILMLAAAAWSASAQQPAPNVTEVLGSSGNFSVFLTLAGSLNLTEALQSLISSSSNNVTAFVPLDTAFTAPIVAAYSNLSAANQTSLLLYHVLSGFYDPTQLLQLRNVSTLASNGSSSASFRLQAINASSSDAGNITTVFASASSARVVPNISGIPDPPSPPIAIYPIDAVLLPIELFPPPTSSSSSPSPSPESPSSPSSPSSTSPPPSSAAPPQPGASFFFLAAISLLLPLLSTPSSL